MVIYKVLGGSSLIFSGLWFYYVKEQYEKKKYIQMLSYIKLISYIKTQIECYMLPIDIILDTCNKELLIGCCYDKDNAPKTITDLLNESRFYIDNEFLEKLYDFAQEFGFSYINEQIKLCEKYITNLSEIQEIYIKQRPKDKKLSLAICLSMSLSLILILM